MPLRPAARATLVLGGLLALATPEIHDRVADAHARADRRACFANQKTLAGALEMYTLDY